MRYCSRPTVIEAIQWTGDNLADVIAWAGRHAIPQPGGGLMVQTLSGTAWAKTGDWLIRGPGEVYPCDPAVFVDKYEPA